MNDTSFIAIVIMLHFIINLVLSKEIIDWVPSLNKKLLLAGLLWCIPFAGAIFVYTRLGLRWFRPSKKSSAGGSSVSTGLLEIDAIFNPGTKYVIEARQKERTERKKEGEMHEVENSNIINTQIQKNPEKHSKDS